MFELGDLHGIILTSSVTISLGFMVTATSRVSRTSIGSTGVSVKPRAPGLAESAGEPEDRRFRSLRRVVVWY